MKEPKFKILKVTPSGGKNIGIKKYSQYSSNKAKQETYMGKKEVDIRKL